MKLSDWSLKDFFLPIAGAIVPVLLTLFISATYAIFHPQSEIRLARTMIENKSFYMTIENHNRSSLETINFVMNNSGDLKIVSQSSYVEIKLQKSPSGNSSLVQISQAPPSTRTSLMFLSDQNVDIGDITFTKLPDNVYFVPGHDLSVLSLSATFWAGILVQGVLYFAVLTIIAYWRKSSEKSNEQILKRLEKTNEELDEAQKKAHDKIDKVREAAEREIIGIRNAQAKFRIANRSVYLRIERENNFWRSLVNMYLSRATSANKETARSFIRALLMRVGIRIDERLSDLNAEMLIAALEEKNSASIHMQEDADIERARNNRDVRN